MKCVNGGDDFERKEENISMDRITDKKKELTSLADSIREMVASAAGVHMPNLLDANLRLHRHRCVDSPSLNKLKMLNSAVAPFRNDSCTVGIKSSQMLSMVAS